VLKHSLWLQQEPLLNRGLVASVLFRSKGEIAELSCAPNQPFDKVAVFVLNYK